MFNCAFKQVTGDARAAVRFGNTKLRNVIRSSAVAPVPFRAVRGKHGA